MRRSQRVYESLIRTPYSYAPRRVFEAPEITQFTRRSMSVADGERVAGAWFDLLP
jgi:hypothetical protein